MAAGELNPCSRIMGPDYPGTLVCMHYVAFTWESQGKTYVGLVSMEKYF